MSPAAAEVAVECGPNLRVCRMRILPQERGRPDNHAIAAIAALGCLFREKRLLDRMQDSIVGTRSKIRQAYPAKLRTSVPA